MKTQKKRQLWARLRAQRGQAMVAYAVVTFALLTGALMMVGKIIPDLLEGMDQYAMSLYMGINLPFP